MTIGADNTWGKISTLVSNSCLIWCYTILVWLWIYVSILAWWHLIPIFYCNLWAARLHLHGFHVILSELWRLWLFVAFAVHHGVLIFSDERIELIRGGISWSVVDGQLTGLLMTWVIQSLNSRNCDWLCIGTGWRCLRAWLIVITLWDLLTVNLKRAWDVNGVRVGTD